MDVCRAGRNFAPRPQYKEMPMITRRNMTVLVCGAAFALGASLLVACGSASTSDLSALLAAATSELSALKSGSSDTSTLDATAAAAVETAGEVLDEVSAEGGAADLHLPPDLTDEQRAAIEALRTQLAAGDITQVQFCQQLHDILGDPPCGPPLPPIDLTDDQVAQAEAIFQAAHDEVVTLHATGRADVLALLTADQQTALTALEANEPNVHAGLCPPPENAACPRPARVPLPPCPAAPDPNAVPDPNTLDPNAPPPPRGHHGGMGGGPGGPGGPRGGQGFGGGPGGPGGFGGGPGGPGGPRGERGPRLCLSDRVVSTLGLTSDQVAAITAVHETLRTAERQVRDDAQAAFEALLTAEQLAELEALPPPGHHGGHGAGPHGMGPQ
jgi:Spy/CpxP family protein refolding chaperone